MGKHAIMRGLQKRPLPKPEPEPVAAPAEAATPEDLIDFKFDDSAEALFELHRAIKALGEKLFEYIVMKTNPDMKSEYTDVFLDEVLKAMGRYQYYTEKAKLSTGALSGAQISTILKEYHMCQEGDINNGET